MPGRIDEMVVFIDNQTGLVFHFFQTNVATAAMAEAATGVHHKNICRYKWELEKKPDCWLNLKKDI